MQKPLLITARSLVSLAALGVGLAYGCSSDPEEGNSILGSEGVRDDDDNRAGKYTPDAAPPTAGTTGFGGQGQSFGNVGNDTGGQGGSCAGIASAAEPLPVDMYIMLDKSSSMAEPLGDVASKWEATVSAIQSFVNSPRAAGIGVGIQYFGLPDACNVDAYSVPAVPIGRLPAAAPDISNSVALEGPATLTPTAPALEGALRYMQTWAQANPQRAAVVVLATDGFPTECDPTSISDIAAIAQQYAEADPPVLTFVVGVAQGLANLDTIARGGGTGSAYLIDGGNVEEEFLNAMLSISSTPLSCDFDIPDSTNPDEPIDFEKISVLYTAAATQTTESIVKVAGASQCTLNQGEGWYYDYEGAPERIFICPETCKKFRAGSVSIELGCAPPVAPIN